MVFNAGMRPSTATRSSGTPYLIFRSSGDTILNFSELGMVSRELPSPELPGDVRSPLDGPPCLS